MGHSSPRAALIYLHGSDARQQTIADGLSELAGSELRKSKSGRLAAVLRADRAAGTKGPGRIMKDARWKTWRSGELGCCGVGLRGLEPRTSSLSGKRSNRLSYNPIPTV